LQRPIQAVKGVFVQPFRPAAARRGARPGTPEARGDRAGNVRAAAAAGPLISYDGCLMMIRMNISTSPCISMNMEDFRMMFS